MKFMKLGTQPDTFYTEEGTRTLIFDAPSDIVIRINTNTYLLHKNVLLPKCGLLQRLCSKSDISTSNRLEVELHDIPGHEDAFELCAKFCYGISINLSAHNFVPAYCAAKFLLMTELVERGNFIVKLEAFFNSCILQRWRDPIVALQTTIKLPQWSENLGVIRKCIDSIVDKILTPPAKVEWSYTYTRPGYNKKHQKSVPLDWWTEDISNLDINLFRCIITATKSANVLPPQLIGESLHVYASRWLPDITKISSSEKSLSQTEEKTENNRRIVEIIVSLIPPDRGSVSVGFLLRLLGISNYLGLPQVLKAELIRKSSLQLEEAKVSDLLFPSHSHINQQYYDTDMVEAVLESFMELWKRQSFKPGGDTSFVRSIGRVGKLIDSYLQVVARDKNMPLSKIISLAEAVPEIARPKHDDLYKAINMYLEEHPDLSKTERKRLCRYLDCQKLSPDACAHAIKNEKLPLRTVVQVLFTDHERDSSTTGHAMPQEVQVPSNYQTTARRDQHKEAMQGPDNECTSANGKLPLELEKKMVIGEIEEEELNEPGRNIKARPGDELHPKKLIEGTSRSNHRREKGKERL